MLFFTPRGVFFTTMRHIATHEEGKRKRRSTPGKGTGVVMIILCPRTSCLKICYYAAKVQSFVFLYTTPPYAKRQKCIAKQQYILLKQL